MPVLEDPEGPAHRWLRAGCRRRGRCGTRLRRSQYRRLPRHADYRRALWRLRHDNLSVNVKVAIPWTSRENPCMSKIAVVGAGVAGLGAAMGLRARQISDVTIFEASPRIGGRVSTVERGPIRFDDGAQFVRTDTPGARRTLLDELPAGDLLDIRREVRPFDRKGDLGPGDPAQNAEPKWVYRGGLRVLPGLIARAANTRVQLSWPVTELARAAQWTVSGPRGTVTGFDAVLVTCPPASARTLLEHSPLPPDVLTPASEALAAARHRTIISVAFEPRQKVEAPGGAYALVNSDRKHDVSWLAFEESKPGYVPDGRQVLVAQMTHAWSAGRFADPDREVVQAAVRAVGTLLGSTIAPRWAQVTRWPEALPDVLIPPGALASCEEAGLFFAGDAFTGGRVHLALENGLEASDRIARYLSRPS